MSKKRIREKNIKPSVKRKPEIDYPVFCFRHLQETSFKGCKDRKFMHDFIFRLSKICSLGWNEIQLSSRHAYGTEKIPISQIKASIPPIVTPEVEHLLVFRANGDNRPFLGVRNKNVFHIIFIESKFGDIYNH